MAQLKWIGLLGHYAMRNRFADRASGGRLDASFLLFHLADRVGIRLVAEPFWDVGTLGMAISPAFFHLGMGKTA
jgi:hypothetical protein